MPEFLKKHIPSCVLPPPPSGSIHVTGYSFKLGVSGLKRLNIGLVCHHTYRDNPTLSFNVVQYRLKYTGISHRPVIIFKFNV